MLKSCASVARGARAVKVTRTVPTTVRYLHAAAIRYQGAEPASLGDQILQAAKLESVPIPSSVSHGEAESSTPKAPAEKTMSPSEAWATSKLHPAVVKRLLEKYPHVIAPTPAQLAFLMSVLRGDIDVHYKDHMGRGKTFSLVLAALSIAERGRQVVLLLPTPHLVQQVTDYLNDLAGDIPVSVLSGFQTDPDWKARIVVSTPGPLLGAAGDTPLHVLLPELSYILIDEADTQFGPLPGRFKTGVSDARLPVNRHPPALVRALNSLLNIHQRGDVIDFSQKTNANTVWSSATLGSEVRRFVYQRGWARRIVDLDFTDKASDRQVAVREGLAEIAGQVGAMATEPFQVKPEHYAFTVDRRGVLAPLKMHDEKHTETRDSRPRDTTGLPVTLVEAVAFLATTSPPPRGTYSLAVVPDGASIKAVQEEMKELGISVAPLVPESLAGGIPAPPEDITAPILISNRSAVPGLHLPHLHTVYLLNGLDYGSMSDTQRKQGGRSMKEKMYNIIAGRLGRFATPAHKGVPQRVISVVGDGSQEEKALQNYFAEGANGTGVMLSQWTGEL